MASHAFRAAQQRAPDARITKNGPSPRKGRTFCAHCSDGLCWTIISSRLVQKGRINCRDSTYHTAPGRQCFQSGDGTVCGCKLNQVLVMWIGGLHLLGKSCKLRCQRKWQVHMNGCRRWTLCRGSICPHPPVVMLHLLCRNGISNALDKAQFHAVRKWKIKCRLRASGKLGNDDFPLSWSGWCCLCSRPGGDEDDQPDCASSALLFACGIGPELTLEPCFDHVPASPPHPDVPVGWSTGEPHTCASAVAARHDP
ncbi:uncharacterized protein J3D65DRAFT_437701 [Phyllosticta citribraziliensis]|uniref:Uncharacterized protein n=1 Tax=Phyllosticta citribraziliensis TaxID=989973 RepID=A0ABR1LK32_9PEZI